jgi:F0F1-type ATP synthase assembly protein I
MEKNSSKEKNNNKTSNFVKDYSRYFNIAFQMIAIILVSVFGGIKLDSIISWNFPVFTLFLTLVGVILAIYFVIRDLLK